MNKVAKNIPMMWLVDMFAFCEVYPAKKLLGMEYTCVLPSVDTIKTFPN